ncbi:MAG: prepilin-type N-terminal cleavage/methylation domain-containing protein [Bacteroidota bacterium]
MTTKSPSQSGMSPTVSRDEGGYTLIEGVIALALVAVIAAIVFAVYLLAARQVSAWQIQFAATNDVHLIQQRLTTDLRRAMSIVLLSPEGSSDDEAATLRLTPEHILVLVGADSATTSYARTDLAWLRSARPMHSEALVLSQATVERFQLENDGTVLPLRAAEVPTTPVLTAVQLTFVLGRDTTVVRAQSLSRPPQQWPANGL